jgi:hypothetical protein
MRGGLGATIAVLVLLFGASDASAATEVGNVCTATSGVSNITFLQLANVSSALPLEVPTAGVVTKWKVKSELEGVMTQFKVFRPTGNKNEFRTVAESPEQTIEKGSNAFDTRIPVQAGDRFGLFGKSPGGVALYCKGKPGDVMGIFSGETLTTDAPVIFNEASEPRVAVSAIVEPDVDGDGFGDETQDKCPQSAAFQTECPQIGLDEFAVAGKGAVTALVIADHEAPVTVTATSKTGKSSKRRALKGSLTLQGGTQTVAPGRIFKFKLKFTPQLKSRLAALPRGKSLTLTVTASATNLVGQVSAKTTTVKLKGLG